MSLRSRGKTIPGVSVKMLMQGVRLSLILVALLLLASGIWRLAQALDNPTPPPRATLVRGEESPGAYFLQAFAS